MINRSANEIETVAVPLAISVVASAAAAQAHLVKLAQVPLAAGLEPARPVEQQQAETVMQVEWV
ncbi:hypothetical protein [Aurantimonas sp. A3-2-R12]|uniref:hypothetical protein n=1 Tax=Aurantimonas sp. A3-2-R12 TaxID=3114362 RepID=UPI002E1995A8|nr:hypothetical protein [Aurantimonas sp. A3-2-R12]